ncbi:hypothetical protein [Zobellia laminariae]|uniref:hypothetical protein n=1 Tax=Zobellia laminariae TaxID=248906 RepID=UPI0026F4265C|nr:hypothetical protein [Zobellia laminariae]WKX75296.1 hypothetical protein Q5W13_16575 [Zobellia laminariae]
MTNDLQNIRILYRFIAFIGISLYTTISYGNDNPKAIDPTPTECANHLHYEGEYFDFCDTCGCGSSGGSMGYGTGLNNNFIGLRYIGQEYRSRDGIFADSPHNRKFQYRTSLGQYTYY